MFVKQFRYSVDNLGYLVYGKRTAIAIDGGAVKEILDFLKSKELVLNYIINSHSHADHTVGNRGLLEGSRAKLLDHEAVSINGVIGLEGEEIHVYPTPGHTRDSVIFHFGDILITGDTLLNGKVGRCFSGDLQGFFNSVKMIMEFPQKTIVYAGHDYVKEYMDFVMGLEPDNQYIEPFLMRYDPVHVYSMLSDEFKINPFLRFNDRKVISLLEKRGLPIETEYDRWESIMSLM